MKAQANPQFAKGIHSEQRRLLKTAATKFRFFRNSKKFPKIIGSSEFTHVSTTLAFRARHRTRGLYFLSDTELPFAEECVNRIHVNTELLRFFRNPQESTPLQQCFQERLHRINVPKDRIGSLLQACRGVTEHKKGLRQKETPKEESTVNPGVSGDFDDSNIAVDQR